MEILDAYGVDYRWDRKAEKYDDYDFLIYSETEQHLLFPLHHFHIVFEKNPLFSATDWIPYKLASLACYDGTIHGNLFFLW